MRRISDYATCWIVFWALTLLIIVATVKLFTPMAAPAPQVQGPTR